MSARTRITWGVWLLASYTFAQTPFPFTQITWTRANSSPEATAEAQGGVVGGKLYLFGGFDKLKTCCTASPRVCVFDPSTNSWTYLANMPSMNAGVSHGGASHGGWATDGNENIYLAGGYSANASGTGQIFASPRVWRYHIPTNTYHALPDLPVPLGAGQLVYLNGKLHKIAGTNQARTQDLGNHYQLDLNNPSAGWQTLAPLPNPRQHAQALVLNGFIYYIGGQHKHDAKLTTQDDVHRYDPLTNTWTQLADLPRPRSHHNALVMNGRIIVLGGEIAHRMLINDVTAYNPATNTWTALSPLPVTRYSGVVGAINGEIYYATGNMSPVMYKGTPFDPTNVRFEAETNYTVQQDVGTSAVRVASGEVQSAGRDVRLTDIGDQIRFNFQTYATGAHSLQLRIRAGNTANPNLYFTNSYEVRLNGDLVNLVPLPSTLSTLSASYGGAYLGTMRLDSIHLATGAHYLEIKALRRGAGVDFLQVVQQIPPISSMQPTVGNEASTEATYWGDIEIVAHDCGEHACETVLIRSVAPNPQRGDVPWRVSLSEAVYGLVQYTLLDNMGRSVHQGSLWSDEQTEIELPISGASLPKGLYFLQIFGAEIERKPIRLFLGD